MTIHAKQVNSGTGRPGKLYELSSKAQAVIAACLLPRDETTNDDGENIIFVSNAVWNELSEVFPKCLWEKAKDKDGVIQ